MQASRLSILIVDDTAENLRLLSGVLTDEGYEVRPATSGVLALRAVEHTPPDLILLDISMPEMDGYEVCRQLKQREASRDIPVLFLTAFTDASEKVKAFDAGGVDYITKPFQVEEVLARVATHLELRQVSRDLAAGYARLQELERLRENLVQMVVHDMRSPLMILKAHLFFLEERMQSKVGEEAEALEDVVQATLAADRLNRMANDLLDVSRLEDGKLPLALAVCDLEAIARAVAADFSRLQDVGRIDVEVAGDPSLVCDGSIAQRVLENFVTNAVKHNPVGGTVVIRVAREGAGVRISARDEGPGVAPEMTGRLFDKFASLELRKSQNYHSTGLGLTFCKLAIEASGGSIGVEACAPHGSIFWFELPA